MTALHVLVGRRILSVLRHAFPSVPAKDQAIVLAAMSPYPAPGGEAGPGTAHTPAGGVSPTRRLPATPPTCEVLLDWSPAPEHRFELSDAYLEGAVAMWKRFP